MAAAAIFNFAQSAITNVVNTRGDRRGDRSGDRIGDRSSDRSGDRLLVYSLQVTGDQPAIGDRHLDCTNETCLIRAAVQATKWRLSPRVFTP